MEISPTLDSIIYVTRIYYTLLVITQNKLGKIQIKYLNLNNKLYKTNSTTGT